MLNQRRYQIFVSSTYEDLKIERQQVAQAILELEHFPAGMEIFPASSEAQWSLIRKFIAESDYFIVVIGGRYGSSMDETGISYTEKEFDYAEELKIPILGFIKKDIVTIPANKVEKEKRRVAQLQNFRDKVQTKPCRYWDSPEQLGLVVSKSLIYATSTTPRVGWVRSDQAKSVEEYEKMIELRNRIDELEAIKIALEQRNEELEIIIRNSVLPDKEVQPDLLAQGDDVFEMNVFYTGKDKKRKMDKIGFPWDVLFRSIGPSMYGYLRGQNSYTKKFDFEETLEELARSKIIEKVENRKIEILRSDVETIVLQLKQLGLIMLETNEKEYSGWTLTPKGQAKLTILKTQRRPNKRTS